MRIQDIPAASDLELVEAYAQSVRTEEVIRRRHIGSPGGLIDRAQHGTLEALDEEQRLQEAIEKEQRRRATS